MKQADGNLHILEEILSKVCSILSNKESESAHCQTKDLDKKNNKIRLRGYKMCFMLNSAKQEIQLFSGLDKPRMLFFLLINV